MPGITELPANEVLARVKALIKERPALESELKTAWNGVIDAIESRALKARPKPKVFEVNHETEVARLVLFRSLLAGDRLDVCAVKALARVGL